MPRLLTAISGLTALRYISIIPLILLLLIISIPVNAQVPQVSPKVEQVTKEFPPGRGFIPPPIDLSHLDTKTLPSKFSSADLPASWDWREQGKVSPVKNQSTCGACYAFASIANIESKMLIDGEGTFDFSENNAKECNFYDRSCSGGNYSDLANFFSKNGTVLESCDPYVASDVTCNSSCAYGKTLLDWRIISGNEVPSIAILKNYIYTYGPIYTTLYTGDENDTDWLSVFNNYDGDSTLYYTGSYETNHAVMIVGWDNDLTHAGGTGGWIVKNSWGTGWGGTCGYGTEGGYFTIAYGSASIGSWSSFIYDWQDYDNDGELLYYDEGGWNAYAGYGTLTTWGLATFTPATTKYLTRVEFWTNDATTDIDIYIYDDFEGTGPIDLLAYQYNLSFDESGYHSVALDSPPSISGGNEIYAVVKFTNATNANPLVLDAYGPSETSTTYMSQNGSNGSWLDVDSAYGCDVGIRIRLSPTLGLSADDEEQILPRNFELYQNYPNPFNPTTLIKYELPTRAFVQINVYNLLGQKVKTLVNDSKPAGHYTTTWNGDSEAGQEVASGIYFYRLEADETTITKKMILLK